MKRKRHSEEQIIRVLKEVDEGMPVPDAARKHGVSTASIYAWRKKFGGMEVSDARRLRELEQENRRLKQMVADAVRNVIQSETPNLYVDEVARQYGGIALLGTIGSIWVLRPDGTMWDVDDDLGKPLTPLDQDLMLTAIVAGSEKFEWLDQLLPERADEPDCSLCLGVGAVGGEGRLDGVFCPNCKGLGWKADPPELDYDEGVATPIDPGSGPR